MLLLLLFTRLFLFWGRKFLVYLSDLPTKDGVSINLHLAKLAGLVRQLGLVGGAGATRDDEDALLRAARHADSAETLGAAIDRFLEDKRRPPKRDARKEVRHSTRPPTSSAPVSHGNVRF